VPGVLDALSRHEPTSYPVHVGGAQPDAATRLVFDPRESWEDQVELPVLQPPDFLPIVASEALAKILVRKSTGVVSGFVIEGPCAGGHNAPPRGPLRLSADGEPVYGPRDTVDLAAIRKLGLPFWPAGGYGTPQRLREALAEGAAGVQVGTAFALCSESALVPEMRLALIHKALTGEARIFTDPKASPAGFPFKVASLAGTLSEDDVYRKRLRLCDLGFLREAYLLANGAIGYRCPGEPEAAFVAKGGRMEDTVGRKCLCNALLANIGMPQVLADGSRERCLVTLGDDLSGITRFCSVQNPDYTAAEAIRVLLG